MSIVISVIIPVWRDSDTLLRLLAQLPARPEIEIIVAATMDEFADVSDAVTPWTGVRVTAGPRGRGLQMNTGASVASGTWLLFLHADSQVPPGGLEEIASLSAEHHIAGGCFQFALDASGWRPRFMEWGTAQRTRWFQLPYGDQGIFVRRAIFQELGGYNEAPLMEDVEFVRRLRRAGRLYRSERRMVTSARRWKRDGWFRRMGRNWLLMTLYGLGMQPRQLARRYEGRSRSVVAVIARAPSSGGKTRLFASLGMKPETTLPTALLSDTVAAIDRLPRIDGALVYCPIDARAEVENIVSTSWTCLAQRGGDIGQRMAAAFEDLHRLGYDEIVLVGSDLPTLPSSFVARALRALRTREATVVIGPASDGGFYLIGLRQPVAGLFDGVSWSTSDVFRQTCTRATSLGLSLHVIDEWYDVDDVESLERACRDGQAANVAAWCRKQRGVPGGAG